MTRLTERLREVLRTPVCRRASECLPSDASLAQRDAVAEVLGGEWRGDRDRRFLVVDRTYSPGYRHGQIALADALPPTSGGSAGLSLLSALATGAPNRSPDIPVAEAPPRLCFLDLETTGLAGGAGTYAFLAGCGWFDGGSFRIRQFFLASFSAERPLLEALLELLASSDAIVTYNGKTFDVPLVETRFLVHRMSRTLAPLPHVDMLHHARRLWRAREEEPSAASCRLSAIERLVCGHTREDDVPGYEVPPRYFHYVRTADARPLDAVLEHNRLDLLSLAMLTARAARLLEEGPALARTAREALGLGQLYERGGMDGAASASYVRGAELAVREGSPATRAEALRGYAILCRRARRHEDAAAAWRSILELPGCSESLVREAAEALAVHHEHRLRDLQTARRLAMHTLHLASTTARQHAIHHRLARLNRKLGVPERSAPLF